MYYRILTDSSWDMGQEKAAELEVDVIPFFVAKDGVNYQKEVVELPTRELYQFMVDHPGVYPKTAQPSVEEFVDRFMEAAEAGEGVICFSVNQKFSGSYNAALLARQMTLEKYPDAAIAVVDSRQATLMQGLIVQEIAWCRNAGVPMEEAVQITGELIRQARIFFTVQGMDYLVHGGRVGKLAGMTANVLNLCPMICLAEGELEPAGLARGRKLARKKALQMLVDYVKKNGNDPAQYHYIVGFGYDISEGDVMLDMIREAFAREWPDFVLEVEKGQIGSAIGVHTGPYPIGFGITRRWETVKDR